MELSFNEYRAWLDAELADAERCDSIAPWLWPTDAGDLEVRCRLDEKHVGLHASDGWSWE